MSDSRTILILRGIRWLIARELGKSNRERGMELLRLITDEVEESKNEAELVLNARLKETAPVFDGRLKEEDVGGEDDS